MRTIPASKRIYRGEVRRVFPTPEYPDPARAVREDPQGFLQQWTAPTYPYPEGYQARDLTVGQHWSRSPEAIPERFAIEHLTGSPQPGQPMGRREKSAVSRRDYLDTTEWSRVTAPEIKKHENYLRKAEKEGINQYRDLSGGDPDRPDRAKTFNMSVVWHGEMPESYEHGTNYEDELNLPMESKVRTAGARIYIPPTGEVHDFTQRHATTFTPEERSEAHADAWNRSAYSVIRSETSVPWSRVQFTEPLDVSIGRSQGRWAR